jgi:hypothetical protein
MNRLKALHGRGHSLRGTQVYAPRYRSEWLSKIISASIGVATYPGESADAESLRPKR